MAKLNVPKCTHNVAAWKFVVELISPIKKILIEMPTLKFLPQKSLIPHLSFDLPQNNPILIPLSNKGVSSLFSLFQITQLLYLFSVLPLSHSQRFISHWKLTWYVLKPLSLDMLIICANFVMGEAKVSVIGLIQCLDLLMWYIYDLLCIFITWIEALHW